MSGFVLYSFYVDWFAMFVHNVLSYTHAWISGNQMGNLDSLPLALVAQQDAELCWKYLWY